MDSNAHCINTRGAVIELSTTETFSHAVNFIETDRFWRNERDLSRRADKQAHYENDIKLNYERIAVLIDDSATISIPSII